MILRPSKALHNALQKFKEELFAEGYFPEVNWQDGRNSGGGFSSLSFSLYEYQDVSRHLDRKSVV